MGLRKAGRSSLQIVCSALEQELKSLGHTVVSWFPFRPLGGRAGSPSCGTHPSGDVLTTGP